MQAPQQVFSMTMMACLPDSRRWSVLAAVKKPAGHHQGYFAKISTFDSIPFYLAP
ncbi:hypothetical protein EPYR_00635 [Erwinia pyrifoliae DSM 12163]|nr:hypothetical protein EPYR_00635 [Erwinia pyrifoliae DSM 12163]